MNLESKRLFAELNDFPDYTFFRNLTNQVL